MVPLYFERSSCQYHPILSMKECYNPNKNKPPSSKFFGLFLLVKYITTKFLLQIICASSCKLYAILLVYFFGNKEKGRISKRVFQENKARQIFRKTNISNPIVRKRTHYQCSISLYSLKKCQKTNIFLTFSGSMSVCIYVCVLCKICYYIQSRK